MLDSAVLLAAFDGGLVGLPVVAGGNTALGGHWNAHVLEDVRALAGLAGTHNNLHIVRLVVDQPQDAFNALQRLVLDRSVILDVDTKPGHAVGGAIDIFTSAYQLQDL